MGRALAGVGTLLAVCFALLGLAVFLDRREDRVAVDNVLAEDLTRALTLADGDEHPLALAEVTPFPWDRVALVERGTPRARLSRALGFEFKGDLHYDAESSHVFVFVRGGQLARFADYRGRGRFERVVRPIAWFDPESAVFRVRSSVIRPAA